MEAVLVATGHAGDNIYIKPNEKWNFDRNVPENFTSHISKSVPFYDQCHQLVLQLSDYFISKDPHIVELGCSTGHLSHQLVTKYDEQNANVLAVDISESMIQFAQSQYKHPNLSFRHDDITTMSFDPTDLFISFYTLQFIHPERRHALVQRIYDHLNLGGGFIVFEKIRASDARFQDMVSNLYMDYKIANDYSLEEVFNKKKSLVGILEPYSDEENISMLNSAGFTKIMPFFQFLCFKGYLAIK